MRLRFVADGPRDEAVLPLLVKGILRTAVEPSFTPWPRLSGKGYARKLVFAHRQAVDAGANGMVAVVDRDRDRRRTRIAALRQGREQERSRTLDVPIALGQADPHVEAWLLDDPVAIRRGLQLPANHPIPNVASSSYPKNDIEALRQEGPDLGDGILEALSRIAAELDPARCVHIKQTGFGAFQNDVQHELGPQRLPDGPP